ncbi:MAG TPA: hypothetical protein VJN71_09705, partial [Nitrososphaerales archaeon]|nr:hypothetical protein [Nitrososphaerales archaeon]
MTKAKKDNLSEKKAGYPPPRRPSFRAPSEKQLEKAVRKILARKVASEFANQPHIPTYDVKKGQKILVAALTEYDESVVKAYVKGFRELGAKVDVLYIESDPKPDPRDNAVLEGECIQPL